MDKLKDHKHYVVYILRIIAIVWLLSREKHGRYALTPSGAKTGVYVLDTKTSELWVRAPQINLYLGANENPKLELDITD